VKALFAQCDELVPPPLNHMEMPTHILDGRIEDMAIEMLNLYMEKKSISMFQVEGVQIFTPLQTTQRVIKDQQIITFKPFDMFHYLRD
jgi:hypothetical protein